MKTLEVRCCCRPQKLLGWLEVENENARCIVCPLMQYEAVHHRAGESMPLETVALPIAELNVPLGQRQRVRYRAVKADGVRLETLKRIRGFREYRA